MALEIVFSLGSRTPILMFSSCFTVPFFPVSFPVSAPFSYLQFLGGPGLDLGPTFCACSFPGSSREVMAHPDFPQSPM